MKILSVIAILFLVLTTGCGGNSSPVQDYNAAVQALDRNMKLEEEFAELANDQNAKPEQREQAKKNLEKAKRVNEKLRQEISKYSN